MFQKNTVFTVSSITCEHLSYLIYGMNATYLVLEEFDLLKPEALTGDQQDPIVLEL